MLLAPAKPLVASPEALIVAAAGFELFQAAVAVLGAGVAVVARGGELLRLSCFDRGSRRRLQRRRRRQHGRVADHAALMLLAPEPLVA